MAISVDRIRADIEAIARCTETPGNGATRPTFSRAWGEARACISAGGTSSLWVATDQTWPNGSSSVPERSP